MPTLRRPRHATVVAYLALFLALTGSGYAALSITGRDVQDGSLTGRDIGNNSLTGGDLRGISGRDVRNDSLTGADLTNLRRGDFVSGELTPTTQIVQTTVTVPSNGAAFGLASCPSDQVVTGGGFNGDLAGNVAGSLPAGPADWGVQVINAPPGLTFQVYAVCSS
jgi:hypothetical protein